MATAFAAVWLVLRRRRSPSPDSTRPRRRSAEAERALRRMAAAAASGDAAEFFITARDALRLRLSIQDSQVDELGAELRELFALADEANYSGQRITHADFERWMTVVRDIVDERAPRGATAR